MIDFFAAADDDIDTGDRIYQVQHQQTGIQIQESGQGQ